MDTTALDWATTHPYIALACAVLALGLAAGAVWCTLLAVRSAVRPQASVVVAAIAAAACTAYSADTSWRFAAHRLGMDSELERAAMFAAAELALFACALMARASLRDSGAPGTPGLLVWVITGVQVIPAFVESGFWGGTVRAFVGPILAALLWHLAMGIEVRHAKPGTLSSGLPAMIGRELRERLLSRLGLATRDRTAEQITRDRATARAVRLAARPTLRAWGRARLSAAVARASVGTDESQREQLLRLLAARRSAMTLATIELPSPWDVEVLTAEPEPPLVLDLARMDSHPHPAMCATTSTGPAVEAPAASDDAPPHHPDVDEAPQHEQPVVQPVLLPYREHSEHAPVLERVDLSGLSKTEAVMRLKERHPDVSAGELARRLAEHGIKIKDNYVRTVLTRKRPKPAPEPEVEPSYEGQGLYL
jgi:hypothetical protein